MNTQLSRYPRRLDMVGTSDSTHGRRASMLHALQPSCFEQTGSRGIRAKHRFIGQHHPAGAVDGAR